MKIIGVVVTLALLSLLLVWWINFSIGYSKNSVLQVQQADPTTGKVQTDKDPLEYTEEEIDQYEEYLKERSDEMENLQ